MRLSSRSSPQLCLSFFISVICGSGCGDASVHIRTDRPLTVTILPWDPQAIRDSLTALAAEPRPAFPELEAWFRSYQPPELADTGRAAVLLRATRDSIRRLADSLRAAGAQRHSQTYRAAYGRFGALYQRFAERTAAHARQDRSQTADLRAMARRAGQAADQLRRWEAEAWADYFAAAREAHAASGRDSVVMLDSTGMGLQARLPSGRWWITARARVPDNPFLELEWHVPVTSRWGLPFAVPLVARMADTVWRH